MAPVHREEREAAKQLLAEFDPFWSGSGGVSAWVRLEPGFPAFQGCGPVWRRTGRKGEPLEEAAVTKENLASELRPAIYSPSLSLETSEVLRRSAW